MNVQGIEMDWEWPMDTLDKKDESLRRMEPNLGKAGIREGLSEEERRTLSSWLEEFSSHTHLPRAYQV